MIMRCALYRRHLANPLSQSLELFTVRRRITARLILLLLCFYAGVIHPQITTDLPLSTEDHLTSTRWWPTKPGAPQAAFAGTKACGDCHTTESASQPTTPMAQAAFRTADGVLPRESLAGSSPIGSNTYRILTQPGIARSQPLRLQANVGGQSSTASIAWIIGADVHGQTYILGNEGAFAESQVSSFSSIHGLSLTPGHAAAHGPQPVLGEALSPDAVKHCFSCHTTASSTVAGFELEKAEPGVHCEACHGPGVAHIATVKEGQMDRARAAILDPAHLSPSNSIDFCGACHRTSMDVLVQEGVFNVSNVRFQPYRLEKSSCWLKTQDARLTCIACHNPHEPLVREAGYYDRKCLSCHSPQVTSSIQTDTGIVKPAHLACPKASENCTSCHMPKYDVPEMHAKFTDHFIRIVRAGSAYPP